MVRYLRTNTKLPGEITPRRAARILGVHDSTIYRWCQDATDDQGPLRGAVRVSITGWYYIETATVKDLAKNGKPAPDIA